MTEMRGDPNFTIILPGECQAACAFCYWKQSEKVHNDQREYLSRLRTALRRLPDNFRRVTLSGGEPTLSPVLREVVSTVRAVRDWDAVVLSTNGARLGSFLDLEIDHVNISRHDKHDGRNQELFGTNDLPSTAQLRELAAALNRRGIDVTLNAVLCGQFQDADSLVRYIDFAKEVGASAVMFRGDQRDESTDRPPESLFNGINNYSTIEKWSCEACMVWRQLIRGLPVFWKASVSEPSQVHGAVYELVCQQDGTLTSDWAGENEWTSGQQIAAAVDVDTDLEVYVQGRRISPARGIRSSSAVGGGSCGGGSGGGGAC